MQVNEIINIMQKIAPPTLAEKWDNIGLLVGSTTNEVRRILITLDVTPAVVNEAIEQKIDLIIAHHPLIFKGIKSITNQTTQGQILLDLISHNINLYVAHTNLDSVSDGMNDWLAKQLKLNHTQVLVPSAVEITYQLMIETSSFQLLHSVKTLLLAEGIKDIEIEESEQIVSNVADKVIKLVIKVPENKLMSIMKLLKELSNYEQFNYHMIDVVHTSSSHGIGKIGELSQNMTLLELSRQCKHAFNTPMVKMIGPANKIINKVAIVGGAGRDFISQAKNLGADVYITGDITYHAALDALDLDIAIIDAGHYIEHIVKTELSKRLIEVLNTSNIEIIESTINTNPYKYIMS